MKDAKNVLGKPLQACCTDPMTGFYRDGYCRTSNQDTGTHVACAVMTADFLEFTRSKGNDLSTPIPAFDFPGLSAGDKWCLCINRWMEAEKAGKAPNIDLNATDQKALNYSTLKLLKKYAV